LVGWSNPCIEIWFFAYFGDMPSIKESFVCCDKFKIKYEKVTGQKYDKADENIYNNIYFL